MSEEIGTDEKPVVRRGDFVEYMLSMHDCRSIEHARVLRSLPACAARQVIPCEVCTMLVTHVYSDEVVSGQVFLDGPDVLYVEAVAYGEKQGEWCWRDYPL